MTDAPETIYWPPVSANPVVAAAHEKDRRQYTLTSSVEAQLKAADSLASWLKASLGCEAHLWDEDQRLMAESDLADYEASKK